MASQCGCSLTSKDLTVIEDQLTHLATACRVAQGYAGSFQNPQLRTLAGAIAQHHCAASSPAVRRAVRLFERLSVTGRE